MLRRFAISPNVRPSRNMARIFPSAFVESTKSGETAKEGSWASGIPGSYHERRLGGWILRVQERPANLRRTPHLAAARCVVFRVELVRDPLKRYALNFQRADRRENVAVCGASFDLVSVRAPLPRVAVKVAAPGGCSLPRALSPAFAAAKAAFVRSPIAFASPSAIAAMICKTILVAPG